MRWSAASILLALLILFTAMSSSGGTYDELSVFLLDVSGSMVDNCDLADPDCQTRLEQAVSHLSKTLEVTDFGTVVLLLFAGRPDKNRNLGHPFLDLDQAPSGTPDGPVRSIYTLELGSEGFEAGADGYHTRDDLDQLLRFLNGGSFTYRALDPADDPNQEGSGVRVADWPGVTGAVISSALGSRTATGDFSDDLYNRGPYYYGRCTALYAAIFDALTLANNLGDYSTINLCVLTDWDAYGCDTKTSSNIAEAIDLLGGAVLDETAAIDLNIRWYCWDKVPETIADEVTSPNIDVKEEVHQLDKPYYSLYFDRARIRLDSNVWNAWYDDTVSLFGAHVAHVLYTIPEEGRIDPRASLDGVLEFSLSGSDLNGIDLAYGSNVITGNFNGGSTFDLHFALSQDAVRHTILSQESTRGWLNGRMSVQFTVSAGGAATEAITPMGMLVQIPYEIPNIAVDMRKEGTAFVLDLNANKAFLDARNPDRTILLDFDEDHFDLLVNGLAQTAKRIDILSQTQVRLVPKDGLAAGSYSYDIVVEVRGDNRVNGQQRVVLPANLQVIGFSTDRLVFFTNLWERQMEGTPSVQESLTITGIDPLILDTDFEMPGFPGIDVTGALIPTPTAGVGACDIALTFDPMEMLTGSMVRDSSVERSVRFFVKPEERSADTLVLFRDGTDTLPIELTYSENVIDYSLTDFLPHVGTCDIVGPGETVLSLSLMPSGDLQGQDGRVIVREIRYTRGDEPHVLRVLPDGRVTVIGDAGLVISGEAVESFAVPDATSSLPEQQDAYTGRLEFTPVSPDVWLRDPAGELTDAAAWEYAFQTQEECAIEVISPSEFTFGNAILESPVRSIQVLVLGDGGNAPARGQIAVEAESVELLDPEGEIVRAVPGSWFSVTPIAGPFARDKGYLQMTVSDEVLEETDLANASEARGTLVLTYDPPGDATAREQSTTLVHRGADQQSVRISFTVDLTRRHVYIRVPDELVRPDVQLVSGQPLIITAEHAASLEDKRVTLTPSANHFDIEITDDGTMRTWTLTVRDDCLDVRLGDNTGRLTFEVPGEPNAVFRLNGETAAVLDYQFRRSAAVEVQAGSRSSDPLRVGVKNGAEVGVWDAGTPVKSVDIVTGDDEACLEQIDVNLGVTYRGTTDAAGEPLVYLQSSDGVSHHTTLPANSGSYLLYIREDAPLGHLLEGVITLSPQDSDAILLSGDTQISYHVFVQWRLMEVLKTLGRILLYLSIGALGAGLLFVIVQSIITRGNPPWVTLWDVLFDPKRRIPMVRLVTVVLIGVAATGAIVMGVVSHWTC